MLKEIKIPHRSNVQTYFLSFHIGVPQVVRAHRVGRIGEFVVVTLCYVMLCSILFYSILFYSILLTKPVFIVISAQV